MSNLPKITSGLITPPGLKVPKLHYLTSSHILELVKQGRFNEIPADIILCHFDNLYKFYVWNLKQEEQKKQAEKNTQKKFWLLGQLKKITIHFI
jgi:hypothetical protein